MKIRIQTWLVLIAVALGLLPAAIFGLFAFMSATATPLHPSPRDIPSVSRSAPLPQWTDAVEHGRQIARAALTEQNLPGVSVAVGVGGDLVWAEGFGWADLENQVQVEPDTQFRIGTASTALTSAAVGLLLEKNRLKLDDEIQTYVPTFPRKQWPITLRQLMGHLAGVRNDAGDEEQLGVRCEQTVEGLQRFAERPLLFEPGTEYRYSSYGWILASAAVETAAEEPFFTFMRKNIFEPLGMENTTADGGVEAIANRSNFYFPRFAADPRYGPQPPQQADYSCFAGASAFFSTPSDLVRFAITINRGTLLQPATVRLLQTSQRLPSGQETGYGLGWDLESVSVSGRQTLWVGHDGDLMGGTVATIMTLPEHDVVVSVLSNISFSDAPALALKVAQAFVERGRSRAGK